MRARVLKDLGMRGPLDIKLRAGGLLDVEFCAQALQLLHAGRPGVLRTATRDALAALGRIGALAQADAALLIEADRIWRSVQGLLRIMHGRAIPSALSPPLATRIARATGLPPDPPCLSAALDDMAARVREVCARTLGETDAT
jgi:glutamate-ammonia-ligase adenylyltransferase